MEEVNSLEKVIKKAHSEWTKIVKIESIADWCNYVKIFTNLVRSNDYVVTACKLDMTDYYLLHACLIFPKRITIDITHVVHRVKWRGLRPALPVKIPAPVTKSYQAYLEKIRTLTLEKKMVPIHSYHAFLSGIPFIIDVFNFADDLYYTCTGAMIREWPDLPEEIKNRM